MQNHATPKDFFTDAIKSSVEGFSDLDRVSIEH